MNHLWSNVTAKDILKAIEHFDGQKQTYSKPRNTFLIFNNKKYPAKHIRGLAYQIANKKEISKKKYSGGLVTAKFFKKLGFNVQFKNESLLPKTNTKSIEKIISVDGPKNNTLNKKLGVRRQKEALQELILKHFGFVEIEKKFDWLEIPNHADLPAEYIGIVNALLKYRGHDTFQKSNYPVRCDIVIDYLKVIIEYDENQHFSKARKISLEHYPDSIKLYYSKQSWIDACKKINAKDNDPIDRDERRAYRDTIRDIEAYKHGYTLIRIKHGAIDWEADVAKEYLQKLLSGIDINVKTQKEKHKIARLIVTDKQYDNDGNLIYSKLEKLIEKFVSNVYQKKQFEFILTPGGFLSFVFPENLNYDIDLKIAEKEKQISDDLKSEANKVVIDFFEKLPKIIFENLKEICDYFTVGIDGFNKNKSRQIELVAIYELKTEKVIGWTGKFYPTSKQEGKLIKITDLNTHFIKLNNQNVVILGCHDLNVYNRRGQARALAGGDRRNLADRFKKMCKKFQPSIILQHPHSTVSPKTWGDSWRNIDIELPTVRHFASGIKYYRKESPRRPLNKVLEKTKKGDVTDFYFNNLANEL